MNDTKKKRKTATLLFACAFFFCMGPDPRRCAQLAIRNACHCEERSDAAISLAFPASCHCEPLYSYSPRRGDHRSPALYCHSEQSEAILVLRNVIPTERSEWSVSPIMHPAYPCAQSEASSPAAWDKLSSYTTYFNKDEKDRSQNIAIAASLIDGIILQAYGEFSFNQTVGRRTAESGFKQAKIIVNGEYVLGVGGGVCQVSTTLYNAALKSGLIITEFHPHSLRVSYVDPSRDAMVSTQSDLKLYNPYSHPVRLQATVFEGGVKISFFGKNEGDRYEIVSETLGEIPPPPPIVKEGETEEILRSPKNGIKSQAFIERYRGETLLSRKRLRTDEYRPVQGIVVKKIADTTN